MTCVFVETKEQTDLDMHVYVDREDKPMRLVFGVLLRGAPSPTTPDHANKVVGPTMGTRLIGDGFAGGVKTRAKVLFDGLRTVADAVINGTMSDITRVLAAASAGDAEAAQQLWPLVYDELRRLATQKLAREKPGQTLQATALVHEAYLRLAGQTEWRSRGHFFAAAAEAMRRILVENARRKQSQKHGGGRQQVDADPDELPVTAPGDSLEVLAVHEALDNLAAKSPRKAELVKLRYFLGCTIAEAAEVLGIAHATAEEDWTYARAWLRRQWLQDEDL